jgi:hypothetical protein
MCLSGLRTNTLSLYACVFLQQRLLFSEVDIRLPYVGRLVFVEEVAAFSGCDISASSGSKKDQLAENTTVI